MSEMTTGEDFASDFLQHYGVKGMRWGHRKAADSGGSGGSGGSAKVKKKAGLGSKIGKALDTVHERDQKIEAARLNVEKMRNEAKGAKRQMKSNTRVFSKDRKAGRNEIRNMKLDILNHPDAPTAARLTSGEIMAQMLFGSPAAISAQTRIANQMERRQATGYYNSKKR